MRDIRNKKFVLNLLIRYSELVQFMWGKLNNFIVYKAQDYFFTFYVTKLLVWKLHQNIDNKRYLKPVSKDLTLFFVFPWNGDMPLLKIIVLEKTGLTPNHDQSKKDLFPKKKKVSKQVNICLYFSSKN